MNKLPNTANSKQVYACVKNEVYSKARTKQHPGQHVGADMYNCMCAFSITYVQSNLPWTWLLVDMHWVFNLSASTKEIWLTALPGAGRHGKTFLSIMMTVARTHSKEHVNTSLGTLVSNCLRKWLLNNYDRKVGQQSSISMTQKCCNLNLSSLPELSAYSSFTACIFSSCIDLHTVCVCMC